jgi:hypothetical protein
MYKPAVSLSFLLVFCPLAMHAQNTSARLPDAPQLRLVAQASAAPTTPPPASNGAAPAAASIPQTLTRQQAEQLALKSNPRISVATLI